MLTAKEAKELATKIKESKLEEHKNKIVALIEQAAKEGKYAVNYDGSVPNEIIELLKSNGYEVQITNFRNEHNTYIQWI